MAETAGMIQIEIAYAEPQHAIVKSLSLPQGARVADALLATAEEPGLKSIDFARATIGIHGQVVRREQVLSDGDRIEIYRPLAEDPKTARRKRARRPLPGGAGRHQAPRSS